MPLGRNFKVFVGGHVDLKLLRSKGTKVVNCVDKEEKVTKTYNGVAHCFYNPNYYGSAGGAMDLRLLGLYHLIRVWYV